MSWDVLLMNPPSGVTSIDNLGEDLPPLGSRKEVLSILTHLFSNGDFSDTSWEVLRTEDHSVDFNLGDDDPVVMMILHVRGSDEVIGVIQEICEYTGWRAFDSAMGDFINFHQNPAAGLQKWRAYRDQVMGR